MKTFVADLERRDSTSRTGLSVRLYPARSQQITVGRTWLTRPHKNQTTWRRGCFRDAWRDHHWGALGGDGRDRASKDPGMNSFKNYATVDGAWMYNTPSRAIEIHPAQTRLQAHHF